jgi:hypothetical protein
MQRTQNQRKKRQSNVIQLDAKIPAPHPERLDVMRKWHQDKAAADSQALAAIHLSLTEFGTIKTEGVNVEPEHAKALLDALPRLAARLHIVSGAKLPAVYGDTLAIPKHLQPQDIYPEIARVRRSTFSNQPTNDDLEATRNRLRKMANESGGAPSVIWKSNGSGKTLSSLAFIRSRFPG